MAWGKSAALAGMLALSLGASGGPAARAQRPNTVPKETCAAPVPPPPALAAWSQPTDLAAARHPADLAQAALIPGHAVNAQFFPVADVDYRVPPEKADGPQVYGGMFVLRISQAGLYRVAAGAGPWIDLFKGGAPETSVAHGHGPACSGVGKMVDFNLQPGDYLVQFSESLTPRTEILVALLPPQ